MANVSLFSTDSSLIIFMFTLIRFSSEWNSNVCTRVWKSSPAVIWNKDGGNNTTAMNIFSHNDCSTLGHDIRNVAIYIGSFCPFIPAPYFITNCSKCLIFTATLQNHRVVLTLVLLSQLLFFGNETTMGGLKQPKTVCLQCGLREWAYSYMAI